MGLVLDAVSKSYGSVAVLRPVSLEIADGEFLTLLGPSGSGKTTLLRLIGGFTQPGGGRILFDGQDLTKVPTNRRPFNTVFQDYALFPHMSVADNVGYGLMIRGRPKKEIAAIVAEALETVGLGHLLGRYPAALSGGQRQRVALARAIVCAPRLILLDEPLSALDAGLRQQMQVFLKDLQRRIGTTFLFVTHDQDEAIALSDRIVVMEAGGIEQVGTPKQIYYAPQTPFVARFFGDNNHLPAIVTAGGALETPLFTTALPAGIAPGARALSLAIRPERISLTPLEGAVAIAAAVESVRFAGPVSHIGLKTAAGLPLIVKQTSVSGLEALGEGVAVTAFIRPDDMAGVEAPAGAAAGEARP